MRMLLKNIDLLVSLAIICITDKYVCMYCMHIWQAANNCVCNDVGYHSTKLCSKN